MAEESLVHNNVMLMLTFYFIMFVCKCNLGLCVVEQINFPDALLSLL